MLSHTARSFRNSPFASIAFAAIAALLVVASPAHAQSASSTCRLLQPAELESALKEWAAGGKAGAFSGESTDSGGITLDACRSEILRPNGNLVVTILLVKNHPMAGADYLKLRNEAASREGQWKVAGAKFEQQTVGSAICTKAGRPSVAVHTVCGIPRGKGYVEVDVQAPTQQDMASMEAVAGLAQKANSRL